MDERLLASLGVLSALGLSQVGPEYVLKLISGLSFTEFLALVLTGSIMVGKVRLAGWKEKMPIYLVRCPRHGYQLTYPQGYKANLVCPKCLLE